MEWKRSESTVKPKEVDATSSSTTVYLHRNIVEKSRTDDMSGDSINYYEYDEAKLTKEEYRQYFTEVNIENIEKQRADIDYIALMSGIELEDS